MMIIMRQTALKALILGLAVGGTAANAAAPASAQGKITVREYLNIGGVAVPDFTGNAKYPDSPDVVAYSDRLEWPTGPDAATPPPGDVKNNYGWTITGYIHPTKTADYIFALAADDHADVWLSTDDNPANAVKICNESDWNPVRTFGAESRRAKVDVGTADERFENVSKKIRLTAGKAYYIQARAKEGGGGDNLAVAWTDDGSLPQDGAEPISGAVLSTVDRADLGKPYAGGIAVNPASFAWQLNDGDGANGTKVDAATIKLEVDGAAVSSAKVTKNGAVTTVAYDVSPFYASGSAHKAKITFNGTTVEKAFNVGAYRSLTAADKINPDTSKPGFSVFTHQVSTGQPNTNARTEAQLAGLLKDGDGNPLPNIADLSGATENGRFAVPEVINFSQTEGENNGNFTPDLAMPGIPGTEGGTDNIAMEILTFIELPKGYVTMGVNSDDGFLTSSGQVKDLFGRINLGEFSGGRGASDTTFGFAVEEAGVFAFRTTWEEGGGGVNIEWFSVGADGKKVLINDRVNGGFKAYRAAAAGQARAYVTKVSPAPGAAGYTDPTPVSIEIVDGATAVSAIAVTYDGTDAKPTVKKSGSTSTVSFTTPALAEKSVHKIALSYTDGANKVSRDWTISGLNRDLLAYWNFNDASDAKTAKDKVQGVVGKVLGAAKYSDDKTGRSGAAGDRAMDFTAGATSNGNVVRVDGASFIDAAGSENKMAVAYWQKLADVKDSSGFWTTTATEGRAFQAHTPWSNENIYFDTSGCCDGGTQRINKDIHEFPGYSGDKTWWNSWHHFAFVKDGDKKSVYVDGKLFFDGVNTAPLTGGFNLLVIGGDSSNNAQPNGWIDDFAVFAGGLTEAEVAKLAAGTAPDAIGRPLAPKPSVGGSNVLSVNDAIRPTSYNSPGAEGVANVLDVKSATKYLNFDKLNTGIIVIPAAGTSVLSGIGLTSANDAPERDPASFLVEGSNDLTTWTKVADGAVAKFSARFTRQQIDFSNTAAFAAYRVTFPTVANATSANSMQIADIELIGSLTGANANLKFPANKVATSLAAGKLTLTYVGVLQSSTTINGKFADVANSKSPFVVTPSAAAVFYRARE